MCYRFVFFAALLLAFITSSSTRKLKNRDDEISLTSLTNLTFPGRLLVAEIPPRTFVLGVLLVVALNIDGEVSSRLNSVVAQGLLNWEIDVTSAYFLILSEYSVVEVTEQLEQLANRTDRLQIEDLQILINATSCSQSTSNLIVSQIGSVILRLEGLFREGSNITLNLGCRTPQENTTTAASYETLSFNVTEEAASERRNHGAARHGTAHHSDKVRHQKGIHGVSSSEHGEELQHVHARDHQLNIRDHHLRSHNHHLHTHNHHKGRNANLQHEVSHDRYKEHNGYSEPHQH